MNTKQRQTANELIKTFTNEGGKFFNDFTSTPTPQLTKLLEKFEEQFPGILIFGGLIYAINHDLVVISDYPVKKFIQRAFMYDELTNCLKELDPIWLSLFHEYATFLIYFFDWSKYDSIISSYHDFSTPLSGDDQLLFRSFFVLMTSREK